MHDADILHVRWEGSACHALLNRPQAGNALSPALVEALTQLVSTCGKEGVNQLVLEGAGRHFCTGFDLSNLAEETDDSLLARFVRIELLLQSLHRAPFDTVARVHGRAAGAGADIVVACRQRLARTDAQFAFPGAAGFGLILGSRRLAALVGPDVARHWITSGCWITADAALASGLATGTADETPAPAPPPDPSTAHLLQQALEPPGADDQDLALLTRSAARPGLKQRIVGYVSRLGSRKPG